MAKPPLCTWSAISLKGLSKQCQQGICSCKTAQSTNQSRTEWKLFNHLRISQLESQGTYMLGYLHLRDAVNATCCLLPS